MYFLGVLLHMVKSTALVGTVLAGEGPFPGVHPVMHSEVALVVEHLVADGAAVAHQGGSGDS